MCEFEALAARAAENAARTQASIERLSDETDNLIDSCRRRNDNAAASDALSKLRSTVAAEVASAREAVAAEELGFGDGETGDVWLDRCREAEWYQDADALQDALQATWKADEERLSPDTEGEEEETAEDPQARIKYLEGQLMKKEVAGKIAAVLVSKVKAASVSEQHELAVKIATVLADPHAKPIHEVTVERPPNGSAPRTPPKGQPRQPPHPAPHAPQEARAPWRPEASPVPQPPPGPPGPQTVPPPFPPLPPGPQTVPPPFRAAHKAPPRAQPKMVWRELPGNPAGGRFGARGGQKSWWYQQEHIARTQSNRADYLEWLKNNPKPKKAPPQVDWSQWDVSHRDSPDGHLDASVGSEPSSSRSRHYIGGNELDNRDWAVQPATRRRTDTGGYKGGKG